MTIVLAFMAVIAAIAAWWLSQQRLMAKPWLETGAVDARSVAAWDGRVTGLDAWSQGDHG